VPGAYYVHPEFGYFSPAPRLRRELRVALISILLGMAVGAAIVSIHSGKAVETDSISSNAHLKSDSDKPVLDVAGSSFQFKNADVASADPVEPVKQHRARKVPVPSNKAASAIAGIPVGRSPPPEPDTVPATTATGSPAASLQTQSSTSAKSGGSGARKRSSVLKKRLIVVHTRRRRQEDNETARWQNQRAPSWGERSTVDDQYWRRAYRNWANR
jgi:hypothetical protein